MTENLSFELAEHFFRHNHAKMVAILVRYFGLKQVEIAEDIVQDTLVEAMEKWSVRSIPDNPEAWLMDVAKKKTINYLKRNHHLQTNILPQIKSGSFWEQLESHENDSTLRMIFACCHPELPVESQISLALKTLCGLSVPEIARALLTTESNINKRLYRAKEKFRDGSIEFEIPAEDIVDDRLDSTFATLYLLFNEGYYSSHHEKLIRIDLCYEATRLLDKVLEFYPKSYKAKALLALMFFGIARFESRVDTNGLMIKLPEQNRQLWDKQLIARGLKYLHESTIGNKISVYHLQAGISAEHCVAESFETTDWHRIYDQFCELEKLSLGVMISFNKCIAKFYSGQKKGALSDLLNLQSKKKLQNNAHYHTALGVFYADLNQKSNALSHFQKALVLTRSKPERSIIEYRLKSL